jgi:NSS family neurotransmitter:Na+ symporter
MGGFVAFVATAISFFYAVIVGWALFYFFKYLLNPLPLDSQTSLQTWNSFQDSLLPFVFHFMAIIVGTLAIARGVKSIEKVNKVLIPTLLIIIVISVILPITLPLSVEGIAYLFRPEWSQLKDPSIWLQALTQNAWDTGAGWGLFLTYAAYMKAEHGTVKNAFITGIGNNTVSILMAIMLFGTVFSVMQSGLGYSDKEVLEVMQTAGPASTGLTFIWMPQLFGMMPLGKPLAIFFFLGLSFAGFSSLISMLELATRTLVDRGVIRKRALWIVVSVVYLLGIPSAMSLNLLSNQDFVWGIGLMISGALIAFYAIRYGVTKMRKQVDTDQNDWRIKRIWEWIIKFFVPVAVTALLFWWLYLSVTEFAPESWYNPFYPFIIIICLLQWGFAIGLLFIWNNKLTLL